MLPDNLIDPQRFIGQEMSLKLTWRNTRDDYAVVIDGVRCGRIMRVDQAFQVKQWDWHIHGPSIPNHLNPPARGTCDTLAEAKIALRTKFDQWLEWALGQGGKASWYGA